MIAAARENQQLIDELWDRADPASSEARFSIAVTGAATDPRARDWRASLLNNLGWTKFEAGELGEALALFQESVQERIRMGKGQPPARARSPIRNASADCASWKLKAAPLRSPSPADRCATLPGSAAEGFRTQAPARSAIR